MALVKFIHWVFAVSFMSSAYLQINDPDPWVWGIFYFFLGMAAILSGMGRPFRVLSWVGLGGAMILMIQTIPGAIEFATNKDGLGFTAVMNKEHLYVEEFREFGGVLLTLIWLAFSLLLSGEAKSKVAV